MAEVMLQQRTGLSAPASRQDVVSALLSAYGSSFGPGDGSPSAFSPVSADKALPPPPPPRSDSLQLQKKPLPAVRRAEERMSTKFQLRVNEELPVSPSGTRTTRRRIQFRTLSREAKPPSLTLTISNGSTAIVPPTPALSAHLQKSPAPSKFENKSLPSPPPPPPIKSDRRSAQRSAVVAKTPKSQTDLARNDSLLSQGETKPALVEVPSADLATIVKRKALPIPAVRKFKSLAELGAGPRAGKGGPMPPVSMPRPTTATIRDSDNSDDRTSREQRGDAKLESTKQSPQILVMNELPPTPEEGKVPALPVPAPPRKAFVGMGLPSNPRAKGGSISPKHVRGKSSTGLDVLKAQRPAPPIPTRQESITPEMTPSPELRSKDDTKMDIISPLSPLPPPTEQPPPVAQATVDDQRRPFSFEAVKRPQAHAVPAMDRSPRPNAPIERPVQATFAQPAPQNPQRPTSLDLARSSPSPRSTQAPVQSSTPPLAESEQKTTIIGRDMTVPIPNLPPSPVSEAPPTPPPFTPLTRQPIPMPSVLIPAIAPSQLRCYTKHSTSIWSNNTFQPMGCMICHSNDKDRKWTCTWCRLRICRNCSEELSMVPGRNLEKLLDARKQERLAKENMESSPGIVISEVDDVQMYESGNTR